MIFGFVLSRCFVVDEELNLAVKVCGPGGAEMCWKWGDQEKGPGMDG